MELLSVALGAAVAAQLGPTVVLRQEARVLLVEAVFVRAGGGSTAKAWLQTRVKGGTWRDIACFAFTTTTATTWHSIRQSTAVAANIAASDRALTDNTILDGFLGDEIQVTYTTTGTYTGASTLAIRATVRA